ncbi:MAG: magnesium chelatase subunit [Actinomycetota bacterium]|nr:magnesium chelatase subunit [Actinomycetota bacterium]
MTPTDVATKTPQSAGTTLNKGVAANNPLSSQGFPFTAVVGAEAMQLALILNAVSPAIGGVLVRGEKGTAKSTAVRGLAALLPEVSVVTGCRFGCDPAAVEPACPDGPHTHPEETSRPARLVELPVGASEDRVVGSLDLERALSEGVRAFEPGLLAGAHRGILYVDEVNLLADHLVDVLLDASAMGRNHVERDSVSVSHPARFVLIGSMNPEEGELRPQLLDRFGLTVDVTASRDPRTRVEVVRRCLAADADPNGFAQRWAADEQSLAAQIVTARALLPQVTLPDSALRQIAEVCAAFDVDGMRADIVTARAAAAHAAWQGRTLVNAEDVRSAALLALPHRKRRNPFDEPGLDTDALDEALERGNPEGQDQQDESQRDESQRDEPEPDPDGDGGPSGGGQPSPESEAEQKPQTSQDSEAAHESQPAPREPDPGSEKSPQPPASPESSPAQPQTAPTGQAGRAKLIRGGAGKASGTPGRRSAARTGRGRTVGTLPVNATTGPIHLPATLAAAAPFQIRRGRDGGRLLLAVTDLRRAERRGKEGNLVLFVVDASGSMAARARMTEVKGAVLGLLMDAYQRRDKVGLITFRGNGAEVILPPTSSVENAARRLDAIPTGGRTPLAAGLAKAVQVINTEKLRDPLRRPLVLLITDGRADNASASRAGAGLFGHDVVVVDCERGPVKLRLAQKLALNLGAEYLSLDDVTTEPLAGLVTDRRIA